MSNNEAVEMAHRQSPWKIVARGGIELEISWIVGADKTSVSGQILYRNINEAYAFQLGTPAHPERWVEKKIGNIEVTLTLDIDPREAHLISNLPLSHDKFLNTAIGGWLLDARSDGFIDEDGQSFTEMPHEAMDLPPFIWLHPLTPGERADMQLRFIRLKSPESLPLYTSLSQCTSAAEKQAAALAFSGFVSDISTLPAPINRFPALRLELLATLPGEQSLPDIWKQTELLLGEEVDHFLASADWTSSQASVWQSLFVLALTGTTQQAGLAAQLIDILRVGHFLDRLEQCDPRLEAPGTRTLVLSAITALPDAVTTTDLALAAPATDNAWSILGPATLKRAHQCLLGYGPGELADIVNVMPHERQEHQEQLRSYRQEHDDNDTERQSVRDQSQQTSASSDLTNALQEVMASEGVARNLSDVSPSYENLNEYLSGSWTGANAGASWTEQDRSQRIQQLTEKAARHIGDRVTRHRGHVWQQACERRRSSLIDNSGNQRLVGIYHWVDKLMQVHLADIGRRLVLEFKIKEPAQSWTEQVLQSCSPPLSEPLSLADSTPAIDSYSDVLPSNYQALGAQYGLSDMAPPPADTRRVVVTVNQMLVGDLSVLSVPKGYLGVDGQMTLALMDNQNNLTCAVAGQVESIPGTTSTAAALTVVTPATSSSTSVGNVVITPVPMPVSQVSNVELQHVAGLIGAIPVTAMSAATVWGVTLEVNCKRDTTNGDPLLVSWQVRTYERLQQAWQRAQDDYQAALARQIASASAGHTTEIQRTTLMQGCLALLAPAPATDTGYLAAQLRWTEMGWHYEAQIIAEDPAGALAITASTAEKLFTRFLQASVATARVPVAPGHEARLLFALQFPQPWIGDIHGTPATEGTLFLLEELLGSEPDHFARPRRHWTVRLPTSLLYLQQGAQLPALLTPSQEPAQAIPHGHE
ncbi:hypothetical protein [Pseudomonas gingeri]|uniref:hypothetical protein n=1 Tax=Pseudomonas gingeri TaxID=117681 RepID=UPI0015A1F139|nr:hypothetical protein [Pseudomonas gingeri]NWA03620.1 hypothetical protein [Pseudomonas gingeri]NWA14478.1 hypothetical protein [Pseudomonas gingeri]NWA54904.1 hypothetical protein [Pseudomonas gingeri]NWA94628.1 hypothetical protein [Pseudomonas gingeri]NWB01284.1 hypothetical protein [Pseudomonas gingeri]